MGDIVWLASYPKSGTTWLRAFLHNYLQPKAQPHDINRLGDLSASECDAKLYRHYDPRPALQYSVAEVQRLRPLVHRDLTTASPTLVFVKTHNALLLVEGVPLLTPSVTAGSIYLVRDPRAVALSYSHHLGWPVDKVIDFMAHDGAAAASDRQVFERLASWSTHIGSWTQHPNPRGLVLRYEDMLARPDESFGAVIRFLGHEPVPDRLAQAIRFSGFAVLQQQERQAGFAERPVGAAAFFRSGTAEAWRHALSAAQIARIERDHRLAMQRFSYL